MIMKIIDYFENPTWQLPWLCDWERFNFVDNHHEYILNGDNP